MNYCKLQRYISSNVMRVAWLAGCRLAAAAGCCCHCLLLSPLLPSWGTLRLATWCFFNFQRLSSWLELVLARVIKLFCVFCLFVKHLFRAPKLVQTMKNSNLPAPKQVQTMKIKFTRAEIMKSVKSITIARDKNLLRQLKQWIQHLLLPPNIQFPPFDMLTGR